MPIATGEQALASDVLTLVNTTHGQGAKHRWTANKLLKGAGAGADPTEMDPLFAALTDVKVVRKTADETVNNSSALQNDDHLLFAVGANEIWAVRFIVNFLSGTTPDLKSAITVPAGATLRGIMDMIGGGGFRQVYFLSSGASPYQIDGFGVTEGTENVIFAIDAIIINGNNAGNIQLQWAQQTANASDTTVKANSCLIAHKLA